MNLIVITLTVFVQERVKELLKKPLSLVSKDTVVSINAEDWAYYMRNPSVRGLFLATDRSCSADVLVIPHEPLVLEPGEPDPRSGKQLAEKKKYVLELAFQVKGCKALSASELNDEICKCVPPEAEDRILTLLILAGGDPKFGVDIADKEGQVVGKYLAPLAAYKKFRVPGCIEVVLPNRAGLVSLVGEDMTLLLWPLESQSTIPGTPENKVLRAVTTFTSPAP